jgi:hypothetical protein
MSILLLLLYIQEQGSSKGKVNCNSKLGSGRLRNSGLVYNWVEQGDENNANYVRER